MDFVPPKKQINPACYLGCFTYWERIQQAKLGSRARPGHVGVLSRLITWPPFKRYSLNICPTFIQRKGWVLCIRRGQGRLLAQHPPTHCLAPSPEFAHLTQQLRGLEGSRDTISRHFRAPGGFASYQEAMVKGLREPDSLSTSGMTLANSLTFLEGVFLSVKWAVIIVPSSMGRKGLHELFHVTQRSSWHEAISVFIIIMEYYLR